MALAQPHHPRVPPDANRFGLVQLGRMSAAEATLRLFLYVHGVFGVLVGGSMLFTMDRMRGTSLTALASAPGWPWSWACALVTFAALLYVGAAIRFRPLKKVGLGGLMAWNLSFSVGILMSVPGGGNIYPVFVYLHFAIMYAVHLARFKYH